MTAPNSGMGLATVEALSDKGATVIMLCRSEERGRKAVAQADKGERAGVRSYILRFPVMASPVRSFSSV